MNTARSHAHALAVQNSPHKQARIARRKQMSGSDARNLIAPLNGLRGELAARGKTVKNHAAENRRALKQMQAKNDQKQMESEAMKSRGYSKMKQFQGVESRVFKQEASDYDAVQARDNEENDAPLYTQKHKNFLKKKSGDYRTAEQMARLKISKSQQEILAEPSPRIEEKRSDRRKAPFRLEKADLKPRESKNFLAQNKTQMIGAKPKGKGSSDTSPEKHQEYGQVPGYLQQRKKRWEEEERIREMSKPDIDCPDGMVCMPEAERLNTLAVLERSEEEARTELFGMPLTIETMALTKKKNALEAKLKEIEDAKKIFSRPKVFIAQD
ncbi:hypothetical protein TrST_g347 [Triparma strigata]|uniref:Enkurin domain-containing protein n=1 Tax=Triparma strigata TaxID=1606541 RepID=A0A9W7EF92_9STRA|nr:hypothetical protein TrST_g347 [Triparma strigata]